MKQPFMSALLIGAALVLSPIAASAQDDAPRPSREQFQKMSPEEREKFFADRKAKWDGLSKEDKLKAVNERHEKMRKERDEKDAHWKSLSDDEKIKFAEERMKRGPGKHGPDGKGHKGGPKHSPDGDVPPPAPSE